MNRQLLRTAAAVILVLACGAAPLLAQTATSTTPASEEPARSVIYPVLAFLPFYGLDVNLPSGVPCVDCPTEPTTPSGSSSGLSGAWFAGLRLEMGRIAVSGDFNYAGLSAERDSPFLNADVKLYLASIFGGVRVYKALFLDGGARYQRMDATFRILQFPNVDWKPTGWSPAVGTTFRPTLGKHWLLYTHLDYGGFATNDVSTVTGTGRIEWRPIRNLAVTAGYGFTKLTLDGTIRSRNIHVSQTLHGPILGIGIPF